MSTTTAIAPVRKSVRVKAPIAHAFDVFTAGLTRWWPPNRGVGKKPIAKVLMEPKLGGRWLEISEDGTETIVATVIAWDRPRRVVLVWQVDAKWQPDASMQSEVDVRFTADGPDATTVELLHHKSRRWAPKPAPRCVRVSIAAGPACWTVSQTKPKTGSSDTWPTSCIR